MFQAALTSPPSRELTVVSLDWTKPKDPPMSLGHASICAHLSQNGIKINPRSWGVNKFGFSSQEVSQFIMDHSSPNVDVAIGAFIWNEETVQSVLKDLKKYQFPGRILLGGPQVSYTKSNLEHLYPSVDIFVRGYAENAILELMRSNNKFKRIKGVHYANQLDLGQSANIDFNTLPSPFLEGFIKPQRFIRWETQRGCVFECSFCQYRESENLARKRYFEHSRIFKEIDWITDNPIIQDIHVVDAVFNSGPNYLAILERLHQRKYRGKLSLQTRIEMVKPEFLDAVARLNEHSMVVLEFGLQTAISEEQKIINRPSNMKKIIEILDQVHKREIESEISIIFGLPLQTLTSFQKSIDFCLENHAKVVRAFPLMLLRGTPLHDRKDQLGLIASSEIASDKIERIQDGIPHIVSSPSFSHKDWRTMAEISEKLEEQNQFHLKKREEVLRKRIFRENQQTNLYRHCGRFGFFNVVPKTRKIRNDRIKKRENIKPNYIPTNRPCMKPII